jgi:putative hydrolase of the HAD superfamily
MQIDWQNIDTVLLDMDGTLLDLHYDNYFWQEYVPQIYAEKHAIGMSDAKAHLSTLFTKTMGTLEWYCVDFWSEQLDIDIMRHKAELAHKISFRPQAIEFLQRCRQETEDVRLITNAHRKVLNLKIRHTQLDQYFEVMHCSHEFEHPKENLQFWNRLYRTKSFDPERTLFLDDSESVLEAANDYGIKHVFSIARPDSTKARPTPSRFVMLEGFV